MSLGKNINQSQKQRRVWVGFQPVTTAGREESLLSAESDIPKIVINNG